MDGYNRIQDAAKRLGYDHLMPLQERAFQMQEFYEADKNIFVTGSTSSGKTLIPLLHYILKREEDTAYKMLFLVPYRTLAVQKKAEIEELLHRISSELNICVSTSELRENDRDIIAGEVDVAVIIYEKAYHFACKTPDFLKHYNTLVYDEFALSEDEHRGVACDLMLLQGISSSCKLFLLATPHYSWGDYIHCGKFVHINVPEHKNQVIVPREEIPIFLDRCSRSSKISEFHDYGRHVLGIEGIRGNGTKDDLIEDLCVLHLKQGHRILVFMNNCQEVRRMANAFAERLRRDQPALLHPLNPDENEESCFRNVLNETGLLEEDLNGLMTPEECVSFRQGIAYHNSWLGYELRTLVEKELLTDKGCLNVVFSTETMAYGINSSVDVVIVADMHKSMRKKKCCRQPDKNGKIKVRLSSNESTAFLKVNEYQNYIGRAGRYGHVQKGYAYALMTQTPGKSDIRKAWDRLIRLRNDPPRAKSTLLRLDSYCNFECENKDDCNKDYCHKCGLYANEFAMPVLSLIPPEGATQKQIEEQLSLLPGLCKDKSWLERNVNNALTRLITRTGQQHWVRFEKGVSGQIGRYFLTEQGRAVCGMVITMYECDCLRRYMLGTQSGEPDKLRPEQLLRRMTNDPFDLFYTLCALPELQRIAEDFFGINQTNTYEGKKRLHVYNELCTKKLSVYYNTRKKRISQDLYQKLTCQSGDARVYCITNPFDTYQLLLAIMIYEWYRTASVDELNRDLNAVSETVIITPGRISHLTQQTSFYLQALAAICDTLVDPVYEKIKDLLLRMEFCLYFGIRESSTTCIPVEQLRRFTRQQQLTVYKIEKFCLNFPPEQILSNLTRRQNRDWKQILRSLHTLPSTGDIVELLKENYPILVRAETEFGAV